MQFPMDLSACNLVSNFMCQTNSACESFSISETCYRYQPKLSDENEVIAEWLTHDHVTVSIQEQLVSIGAAIQNILLLAHQKGYGAIILSGERSSDPNVAEALGIPTTDKLIGFISIGTIKKPPREKTHPNGSDHLHSWAGLVK
jgi:nitroreductase